MAILTKKAIPKEVNKPSNSPLTCLSDTIDTNPVILLHGQYGAGKTTLAATASEDFPLEMPTVRAKGKCNHVLEDMFWIAFDRDALVGFRERGVTVPCFDVPRFIASEALWKSAHLSNRPDIIQAANVALQQARIAVQNGAKWLVVDTISSYDKSIDAYWDAKFGDAKTGLQKFGRMFVSHKMFHDELKKLGTGIIYCCHSKALVDYGIDPKQSQQQDKIKLTLSAAGMPDIVPDITGKSAGIYKADASLELAVIATREPGQAGKLKRYVTTAVNHTGNEAKNRYELSLMEKEEAHLGKILRKIGA